MFAIGGNNFGGGILQAGHGSLLLISGAYSVLTEKFFLRRLCLLKKHIRLAPSFRDTSAGDVEILGLYLDADELAAKLDGGDARCAAAHERVENDASIR